MAANSRFSNLPVVIVVDADPSFRHLIRVGMEVAGVVVEEAATAEEVAAAIGVRAPYGLIVGEVAEGQSWLGSLLDERPELVCVRMVSGDERRAARAGHARRGDIDAILSGLRLPTRPAGATPAVAAAALQAAAGEAVAMWRELCRWDPMVPPDTQPPIASAVIEAVAEALGRPQPIGWGADPEMDKVAEVFATAVGDLELAVAELICLREALVRVLAGGLPPDVAEEVMHRVHMVVDRTIGTVAAKLGGQLEAQAHLDPLTGLLNRRALDRDLRREIGRSARYGRRFSVMLLDLDHLKAVNDAEGHAAGDALLRRLSQALAEALRVGDDAYRLGGDEFVILLAETAEQSVEAVVARMEAAGAPALSWGAAVFPLDASDAEGLLAMADARMRASKASRPGNGSTDHQAAPGRTDGSAAGGAVW